ncbi:hypothetical protein [Streptomyces sp. NPDC006134]|uniref:hypothetical protein n=1 Tax=Streptomyces sp. NPDC006134 TaxID=3154467 RepID=UPI0033F991FA
MNSWDIDAPTPARARIAATVSILVWCAVIAAGRLLAHTRGRREGQEPPGSPAV